MYPKAFCLSHYEKTGVWLPACGPMEQPHPSTPPPTTTEPTTPLKLTTATDPTTFTDLIVNATTLIANTYLDDQEKILPPTTIPRTSGDYFLLICFWALLVPAVSLILLSFLSWSIWMGLKWFAPHREMYKREKLVFKRGESLSMGWVWSLLKYLSPSATVAGSAAGVRVAQPKGMAFGRSIIRWSHRHPVRW